MEFGRSENLSVPMRSQNSDVIADEQKFPSQAINSRSAVLRLERKHTIISFLSVGPSKVNLVTSNTACLDLPGLDPMFISSAQVRGFQSIFDQCSFTTESLHKSSSASL